MCRITLDEYEEMRGDNMGFCRACGEFADNIDPDTCNEECEFCGAYEVFGLNELLMMGEVE